MIKYYLLGFALLICSISSGQDLKKVKQEDDGYHEIFYVLKENKDVRQGPYEKYFSYSTPYSKGKILVEKGQYTNNEKDGKWVFSWGKDNIEKRGHYKNGEMSGIWEFIENGEVVEKGEFINGKKEGNWVYFQKEKGITEKGYYKEGEKVGIWKYHLFNIPVQTYDYDDDSVLYSFNDNSEHEVMVNGELKNLILERLPQYIGHKRKFDSDISKITDYPLQARRMGIEGTVIVSFMVNTDGTISDIEVIQDIGGGCAEAVTDALKNNNGKWIPALYSNEPIKSKYYQQVDFQLLIDKVTDLGETRIVYK